jgi:hypothetical protein
LTNPTQAATQASEAYSKLEKMMMEMATTIANLTLRLDERTQAGYQQGPTQQHIPQPPPQAFGLAQQQQMQQQMQHQMQQQMQQQFQQQFEQQFQHHMQQQTYQHNAQQSIIPYQPQLPIEPSTPTRNNTRDQEAVRGRLEYSPQRETNGGSADMIRNGNAKTTGLEERPKRNQEVEEEPATNGKRKDKKDTPTKSGPPRAKLPPMPDQGVVTNPYLQTRQLQFRHDQATPHYTPYNFAHPPRQPIMHPGMPGAMMPQAYSQEYYPPFEYPTASQEDRYVEPYRLGPQDPRNYRPDSVMQDPDQPSRPAEDALTYHPV